MNIEFLLYYLLNTAFEGTIGNWACHTINKGSLKMSLKKLKRVSLKNIMLFNQSINQKR